MVTSKFIHQLIALHKNVRSKIYSVNEGTESRTHITKARIFMKLFRIRIRLQYHRAIKNSGINWNNDSTLNTTFKFKVSFLLME